MSRKLKREGIFRRRTILEGLVIPVSVEAIEILIDWKHPERMSMRFYFKCVNLVVKVSLRGAAFDNNVLSPLGALWPWEKGENVPGPIRKKKRLVENLAPCPQHKRKKMLKLINKTIIPPLLHSFRALSGKADVADLILTQYRGRVLRDYLYSGHERYLCG